MDARGQVDAERGERDCPMRRDSLVCKWWACETKGCRIVRKWMEQARNERQVQGAVPAHELRTEGEALRTETLDSEDELAEQS